MEEGELKARPVGGAKGGQLSGQGGGGDHLGGQDDAFSRPSEVGDGHSWQLHTQGSMAVSLDGEGGGGLG